MGFIVKFTFEAQGLKRLLKRAMNQKITFLNAGKGRPSGYWDDQRINEIRFVTYDPAARSSADYGNVRGNLIPSKPATQTAGKPPSTVADSCGWLRKPVKPNESVGRAAIDLSLKQEFVRAHVKNAAVSAIFNEAKAATHRIAGRIHG